MAGMHKLPLEIGPLAGPNNRNLSQRGAWQKVPVTWLSGRAARLRRRGRSMNGASGSSPTRSPC